MSDDVRRLREFRKSAVYLVDRGPYREPRLLDVQYLRILRYADALGSKLQTTFQGRRAYVDPNFPREKELDELRPCERFARRLRPSSTRSSSPTFAPRSTSTSRTSTRAFGIT